MGHLSKASDTIAETWERQPQSICFGYHGNSTPYQVRWAKHDCRKRLPGRIYAVSANDFAGIIIIKYNERVFELKQDKFPAVAPEAVNMLVVGNSFAPTSLIWCAKYSLKMRGISSIGMTSVIVRPGLHVKRS